MILAFLKWDPDKHGLYRKPKTFKALQIREDP
jgi:hypothetical protein